MHSLSQWTHQHDILLVGGSLFAAVAFFLYWRRSRARWWGVWAAGLCLSAGCAYLLRTPPAQSCGEFCEELKLSSIRDIDRAIASFGKPVLLEVYSDFGFS